MRKLKVVLIGAGSASFGRGAVADVMASPELREAELTLTLVDTDEEALDRMARFAGRVKEHHGAAAVVEATTARSEALAGADYVVTAISQKRWELWEQDFYVPHAFGFRQTDGECGGPGGAFHTLRSLHQMIPICRDMERLCPNALLLNYTNPESRVCLGVSKLTSIRSVGLCHGAATTLQTVARILGKAPGEIDLTLGGLNHFHWVLGVQDPDGRDLMPDFRRQMETSDWGLEALTRRMYQVFGLLPFPSDSHTSEYVAFGYDLVGPAWFRYSEKVPAGRAGERFQAHLEIGERIRRVVEGEEPLGEDLARPSGEWAVPILLDIELDRGRKEIAVNVPNKGWAIDNLPDDAVVEVPARVDAGGVHPIPVGPLPEAIAALCRKQIAIQNLVVRAYAEGSKALLLQALSIDPVVNSLDQAERMMEQLLRLEEEFLPEMR